MTGTTEPGKALSGRTIVVVGPGTFSQEFQYGLKLRGAEIKMLPEVETVELERSDRLDEALDHLYGYDWLLFTSEHGVEYFLRHLPQMKIDSHSMDDLRVCAIGEETEERLRLERVHVDVVPPAGRTNEVIGELSQFLGGVGALSGLNFLSPRATTSRDSLSRALSELGARIDLVPAYRLRLANELDPGRQAAMLSGAADYIFLTGPESVTQLKRMFDSCDLRDALAQASTCCFDEATAKKAWTCGLKALILPTNPTVADFAEALADPHGG